MKNNESITGKSQYKILVTGGGGFLGGAIVRQLVERGDRVISFSRRFYSELAAMGVEQIQGDIDPFAKAIKAEKRGEVDVLGHALVVPHLDRLGPEPHLAPRAPVTWLVVHRRQEPLSIVHCLLPSSLSEKTRSRDFQIAL